MIDDDSVPCAAVYWGIGGITAAMIGHDPIHDGHTSWLEPNLLAGNVPHERLDELLDIARQGRFILSVSCPENIPTESLIQKVRTASNIK